MVKIKIDLTQQVPFPKTHLGRVKVTLLGERLRNRPREGRVKRRDVLAGCEGVG